MKKIVKWLWQFPQNLLGFLISRRYKLKSIGCVDLSKALWVDVYFVNNLFGSAISLGDFIILDYYRYAGRGDKTVIRHEYGHQIQSLILGWLYLPVVGLPSMFRNIWDRIFHKKWDIKRRSDWYYSGYPERWADILGGVIRD